MRNTEPVRRSNAIIFDPKLELGKADGPVDARCACVASSKENSGLLVLSSDQIAQRLTEALVLGSKENSVRVCMILACGIG